MKDTEKIVDLLLGHQWAVAVAESCTGGLLAGRLVDVPGVSGCFAEGYVTYSNEAKIKNLGVLPQTLEKYGAVSRETAKEMALGVKMRAGADFGVATTGVAGPCGGTQDKPVGLVYICCAYQDTTQTLRFVFDGDRAQNRRMACDAALELLLACLMDCAGEQTCEKEAKTCVS